MKYIIMLATSDDDARKNYKRLVDYRLTNSLMNEQPLFAKLSYDITNKRLKQNKESINEILQMENFSNKNNIEIEFIAHDHPYKSKTLLIETEDNNSGFNEPIVMQEITPHVVASFFKEHTYKNSGDYNFSRITLYCCNSLEFGKELSGLMPGVNVTCFNKDIRIDHDGIAYTYNDQNQAVAAKPYTFYSGNLITENKNKTEEKKSESANQAQTASTPTSDTLSATNKPHLIRGNQWTKYNPKPQDVNQHNMSNKATSSNSTTSLTEPDTTEAADENVTSSFKPR